MDLAKSPELPTAGGGPGDLKYVVDNVFEVTVRGRIVAMIDRDIHGKVVRTSLDG